MTRVIPIPVRLSVRDETYDPELHTGLVVRVGGELQRNVVSYDIDAGHVTRYALDANDRFIVRGDDIVTEVVSGMVEVSHPANGDSRP